MGKNGEILLDAVRKRDTDMIALLVDAMTRDADHDDTLKSQDALMSCIRDDNTEGVRLLLRLDACRSLLDSDTFWGFSHAVEHGMSSTIAVMLPIMRQKHLSYAFHVCARFRQNDIIDQIVEGRPDAKDEHGNALFEAFISDNRNAYLKLRPLSDVFKAKEGMNEEEKARMDAIEEALALSGSVRDESGERQRPSDRFRRTV